MGQMWGYCLDCRKGRLPTSLLDVPVGGINVS